MSDPMTTAEVLKAAKADISKPEMWWNGSFSSGVVDSRTGVAPCCVGVAVLRNSPVNVGERPLKTVRLAIREVFPETPCVTVVDFNDHPGTTHADVMAVFDKAIEMAEAQS